MGQFAGLNQYKTALHVHSTNSPSDGLTPLFSVIEEHYRRDYDILAITEHNSMTSDWVTPPLQRRLTPQRFAEIGAGVGRNGRPMMMVPHTVEATGSYEHVNTFLINYDPSASPNIPGDASRLGHLLTLVGTSGLAHINHIPRTLAPGNTNNASVINNPTNVNRYVSVFMAHPTCVGMEIINAPNTHGEYNDRTMWDNINRVTIPQGRFVWGFSNDDTHGNTETGYSFNVVVMAAPTVTEFRTAMQSGRFYAVARIALNEGVDNRDRNAPTPVIDDIDVTLTTITITARNHTRIDWISDGATIPSGSTVNIAGLAGPFIRANVVGAGGVAFTQPFRI